MDPATVLDFWFRRDRKDWFAKNPAFDAEIRAKFLATHEAAAAGKLASWKADARSCLALVIVLDQFPRNLYRDDPRAFAADALARDAARAILEQGWDRGYTEDERSFAYLPFEHSEALADQELSMKLFQGHPNFEWARRHWEIIQRFGRFPHRNRILGRHSTPAETEFLQTPGSGF